MRSLLLTISALAVSSSIALAQTPPPPPPPPAGGAPTAEQPAPPPPPPPAGEEQMEGDLMDGPEGGPAAGERRGGPDRMGRAGGPRHQMGRGGGPRHERGMRRAPGSDFQVEIDDDGGVKVHVKCGPREEARACADITMELLDRAMSN